MPLDTVPYADRLLDWLYDRQAALVRQRGQQRLAREKESVQWLRDRHPRASDAEIYQLFKTLTAGILGDRDSEQEYVDVGEFLKPLSITADDGYNIVSHLVGQNLLNTSASRVFGANLGETLFVPPGEERERLYYYDRVIITDTGIRAVEASRLAWQEIMPLAAPLTERLLVWLGNLEDPLSTPAYLPNFLASAHGSSGGRPLFTAAVLQSTVRYLVGKGLLSDCTSDGSSDNTADVRLTSRGLECVLRSHGDVEAYLRVANEEQRGGGYRAHAVTYSPVNERGWGWTASENRRIQLLAWIAEQSNGHPEQYVDIKTFYDGRFDLGENDLVVAAGDLAFLAGVGLIMDGSGIGGIESMAAMLTPQGHDFLEQLRARRADKTQRRTACRDAIVAGLYAADATDAMHRVDRVTVLQDPRYGMWLAMPFNLDDLGDAAAWLQEHRLVDGTSIDEAIGPVHLYLTALGIICAEDFYSDTRQYQEKRMERRSGTIANIGNIYGPVQMAGDDANQVQNINASAEPLRDKITSVAELVRLASPDASDLEAQRTTALTAARDGAVDRSALKRFADWALGVIGKGASAALLPAVTAATNDLLREAERLAPHL